MSLSIPLTLRADELEILPDTPSIQHLLNHEGSCRTQLIPSASRQASAISKRTVGSVAGTFRPGWWEENPEVLLQAVHLFRVTGAYFFPAFGVIISEFGMVMNCSMDEASYVSPDLALLPFINRQGDQMTLRPPREIEILDTAIVTMPWGALHNYGHFVLDCLSAIALLMEIDGLSARAFVFPNTLKRYHLEHFELLGVMPKRLTKDIYFVKNVLFTSCMAHFLQAPNRNYDVIREKQLAKAMPNSQTRRKVYLGRDDAGKRKFLSEPLIASGLRDRGYEIIVAKSLSVREQITTFAQADVIVACAGAGLANALYCRPGTVVIEIQPRGIESIWVRNICLLTDCKWAPYFCDSVPATNVLVIGGKSRPDIGMSFDVDAVDFLSYVDTATGNR